MKLTKPYGIHMICEETIFTLVISIEVNQEIGEKITKRFSNCGAINQATVTSAKGEIFTFVVEVIGEHRHPFKKKQIKNMNDARLLVKDLMEGEF